MRSRSTRLATEMDVQAKHEGVVVPMVTPLTGGGKLDDAAVDRLVEILIAGGSNGIFVLGTTGEGGRVPPHDRQRLVERVCNRAASRVLVYAGIGDRHPEAATSANAYLAAGADAVVARAPISMPVTELESWYRSLLDQLEGPMILYNIPLLTGVSVPVELIADLLGHPRLAGMKDSENDAERMKTVLGRFGGRPDFSIYVGVGKLMKEGLRLGADGIVPSVGNLVPGVCRALWDSARLGDWEAACRHAERMSAVAAVYQAGRDLDGSLCALKGALSLQKVCERHMCPPLKPLSDDELKTVAARLEELEVIATESEGSESTDTVKPSSAQAFPTL